MGYSSFLSIPLHPPSKELHKRKKWGRVNNKTLHELGKIDLSKIHLKKPLEIPVISARKRLNMLSKYIQDFH